MPFVAAIHRLTQPNQTRERALELANAEPDDREPAEQETLTTELAFAIELSYDLGMPLRQLLASLGSREFTFYRAHALVRAAAMEVGQELVKHSPRGQKEQIDKLMGRH